MADDLASLQQFGTFQDEEEMRLDVAARVIATSSRAALEDEDKLKQVWRDLEQAEHRVQELEAKLDEAQEAVQDASASSPSSAADARREVSALRFQLNAAQAEVRRVDALVRQTQADVDRRQAARLAEAARRERAQAEAERAAFATATTSANATGTSARTGLAALLPANPAAAPGGGGDGGVRGSVRPQLQHTRKTLPTPLPSASSASPAAATQAANLSSPRPTAPATARVLYRIPTHLRGVTQSDYSGGEVLPSLSRVQVTRADIRSKQRRYQDDSDLAQYMERITKRQRLEALASQQRRHAAMTDATVSSRASESGSSATLVRPAAAAIAAVAGSDIGVKVKTEEGGSADGKRTLKKEEGGEDEDGKAGVAAITVKETRGARRGGTRSDDAEDDRRGSDAGQASHSTVKSTHKGMSVADLAGDGEDSVIDVDALMEDDDDTAVEALVQRASVQLHKASSNSSSSTPQLPQHHSDSPASLDAHKSQSRRAKGGSADTTSTTGGGGETAGGNVRRNDKSGSDAAAEEELVVEMEEVTLMPGVRMDAVLYGRLLDYQQEGLLWLLSLHARRAGGILGDEMGLGKTIQIAALLNALHHSCLLRGPALIVAPMTVLRQWLAELHRWAPYMRSCIMHESSGSDGTREALLRSVQGTPAIVVTTYAAMRVHCTLLQRTGFQYVILDEGHKISNPEAGITLAAKSFTTPHRLILSGSPIQNSLKELWCLFDFVRPGLLGTMNRFIDEFETPIAQSRNARASTLTLATAVECAKTLQSHIAPFLLRRLKRQVNTRLPPKYERVLRVPLTDQQLEQYLQVLSSPVVQRLFAQTVMYGSSNGGLDRDGRDSTGALHVAGARLNMATRRNNSGVRLESFRLMNQLRQICNHADIYAVQKGADEEDRMLLGRGGSQAAAAAAGTARGGRGTPRAGQHRSFRSNNPVNLLGSGKLNALLMMLREWKTFGHRVLVFSQTRMMLDIIENMCEQQSYTYIRMDGATNGHHRQELMDRFNEDEDIFVALLTTRVGGIGVNLIGADRVVIFDPDWNPITDVQARERAWRIGQKREVCVYRLITSGSVEEAILRRQLAKMYVTDKVLKDPELQRFFHVQDSFMENFLLGSEYEPRVPMDKKYLLTAHQLHNSTAAAAAAAARSRTNTAGGANFSRQPAVDETLGDYGVADSDSDSDDSDMAMTEMGGAEGAAETANPPSAQPRKKIKTEPKQERDFGLLVPVKDEDDENDEDTDAIHNGAGTAAAAAARRRTAGSSETQLLQDLVNHQDIVIAGNDRVAQRLARQKAEAMLQRVASRTSVMDTMREQQKKFSLLHALEEKKAAEAAEREEQRQYYREETAAMAATRRRP